MSSDLVSCFELPQSSTNPNRLTQFFGAAGIGFKHASSRLVAVADDYIGEETCPSVGWDAFAEDMQSATPSLNGGFRGATYDLSLGFFIDRRNIRYALLQVSGKNIDRMSDALAEGGSDWLRFLLELHRTLDAKALALGFEVDPATLIAFLRGDLPAPEADSWISTAIGVPPRSEQILLSNPAVREFRLELGTVLSRWLPGLDQYFSRKD